MKKKDLAVAMHAAVGHADMVIHHSNEAIYHAIECGRELLEVKKHIGHGNFQPWVRANMHVSYRMCSRYMVLAKYIHLLEVSPLDTKVQYLSHLRGMSIVDALESIKIIRAI